MNLLLNLLEASPSVVMESAGGDAATQAVSQAVSESATQAASGGMNFGTIGMIIYVIALIAIFYFLAIRPSRKRDKELKEMQASIQIGDDVMTSSGFYGKVVEMNDQVVTVEFGTNRGVRIPIKKSEIIGNKAPNVSSESK
ncbi:MAG: preprotein translocase subunit YajC [Clostridia bacterium]|nr:preprotein translocase subunit YajC [Clostridia bacterium]